MKCGNLKGNKLKRTPDFRPPEIELGSLALVRRLIDCQLFNSLEPLSSWSCSSSSSSLKLPLPCMACLTVSMALAASFDSFPLLTLDVVETVATDASLGRGVLIDIELSKFDSAVLRCRSGRPAVNSSRSGWPMSLLAAGLSICTQTGGGHGLSSQCTFE